MSETKLDFKFLDGKVFAVTSVFGAIAGLEATFNIYLRISLLRDVGAAAFGAVNLLLSGLDYVLYPVLYFVVLYLYCGGPLLSRMARVLISLVFGSMLGCWVGFLAGGAAAVTMSEQPVFNVYANLSLFLPQYVIAQVLTSFGILAFSDLVPKWRDSVKISGEHSTRPSGIVFLVALYVVFAVLDAIAIPLLEVYVLSEGSAAFQPLVMIVLVASLVLPVIGQLVLAVGLYRGRKWAWILAVISSATGVLINISAVGILLVSGFSASVGLVGVVTGLFIGFLISLAILSYLMSSSVRLFFRFVNQVE